MVKNNVSTCKSYSKKDSYIYILDEAVSNIDDYSKNIVLSAFDSIKEGKIIIIISHDLETIINSDNIYVLKDKNNRKERYS